MSRAPRPLALIRAVIAKELREVLREPHVMIFSLGFPLVFYPLLLWGTFEGMVLMGGWRERAPPRVVVQGPADMVRALSAPPVEIRDAALAADPVAAFATEDVDAVVVGTEQGLGLNVSIWTRSTSPRSDRAGEIIEDRLDELREDRVVTLAAWSMVPPEDLQPWEIVARDASDPTKLLGYMLSLGLPTIVVINLMMAALYPSVDVVVGERERGTLETTLTVPSPRWTLGLGKILAVFLVTMGSATGSFFAAALTLGQVILSFGRRGAADHALLPLTPASLGLSALSLMSAALMASALFVTLSLPTKTFKSASAVVGNAVVPCMFLVLLAARPKAELTLAMALTPLANTTMTLRAALSGEGALELMALGVAVNLTLAALAMAAAALWLNQPGVLLDGGLPPAVDRWIRRLRRKA